MSDEQLVRHLRHFGGKTGWVEVFKSGTNHNLLSWLAIFSLTKSLQWISSLWTNQILTLPFYYYKLLMQLTENNQSHFLQCKLPFLKPTYSAITSFKGWIIAWNYTSMLPGRRSLYDKVWMVVASPIWLLPRTQGRLLVFSMKVLILGLFGPISRIVKRPKNTLFMVMTRNWPWVRGRSLDRACHYHPTIVP